MNIGDFLHINGIYCMQGHSAQLPKQVEILKNLSSNDSIKNILEVGFNAGPSADLFLSSNPNTKLVSFDLGDQGCVSFGKKYIDDKFPSRHTLILGDSTNTIPKYIEENPSLKFDLIFIDGGHTNDIPKKDIINCKRLAHNNTILVMDDILYNTDMTYTVDVTKAWREAISWNIVKEISHYSFNNVRGFSVAQYIF